MKLFTKIFLSGTVVFSAAFLISGYFLIRYSFESSIGRETDFALQQFQYDKFTVQAELLSLSGGKVEKNWKKKELKAALKKIAGKISVPAAFLSEDFQVLCSEIEPLDISFAEETQENIHRYRFGTDGEESHILISGMIAQKNLTLVFLAQYDIGSTVRQQEVLINYFFQCYGIAMLLGMLLLTVLSVWLSSPLKKMEKAADRMAKGDYKERIRLSGRDEIGRLAGSFNRMADAVEEKIGELSENARQKEDFVANFAHELKTPLTSVIGYADMLYQKELPREQVKKAAGYIWNEGMRLEALSLKLMDLIVLNRQEFALQEMPAEELLSDISEGLSVLCLEKGIHLYVDAEPEYLHADYDLFKTMVINIVDNSIKAGADRIVLSGKREERGYRICIEDNGKGIPKEEISRITEAFYMVDKSRSRKQHGAGLGLALAEKIAEIHGCRLEFASEEQKGTIVSFCLPERWKEEV